MSFQAFSIKATQPEGEKGMSLFFMMALIAIAWFFSIIVDALPHLWHHVFMGFPFWLPGLFLIGTATWLMGDRP